MRLTTKLMVMVSLISFDQADANVGQPHLEYIDNPPTNQLHPLHIKGPAVVTKEELRISCDTEYSCSFAATYFITNPTPKPITIAAGFIGGDGVIAKVDEKNVNTELPPRGMSKYKSTINDYACNFSSSEPGNIQGLQFAIPPNSEKALKVTGSLQPVNTVYVTPDYTYTPAEGRHLSSKHDDGPKSVSFCYDIWPIRSWQGNPSIHLTVDTPENAEIRIHAGALKRSLAPNTTTKLNSRKADKITVVIPDGRFDFVKSHGPMIGLGYHSQRSQAVAQLGYEIMLLEYAGLSAGADYRVKDEEFAPWYQLEVATLGVMIIPQIGAGIGQSFAPEAKGAIRANLHLGVGPLIFGHQIDFAKDDAHPFRMWYLQARF